MDQPDLTPELLLQAYAAGIFPMSEHQDDPEIFWVDPSQRGVFPLNGFHISRSLRKAIQTSSLEMRFNADFTGTVRGCAEREETWINGTIFDLYQELHAAGHAHSQEVWEDETLVGGVYGVSIGSAFFGESMFSRRTNASKIALAYLIDRLRQTGFTLFDTQFLTPHLESLGAIQIPRGQYHISLEKAVEGSADINALNVTQSPYDVVQRITQIS